VYIKIIKFKEQHPTMMSSVPLKANNVAFTASGLQARRKESPSFRLYTNQFMIPPINVTFPRVFYSAGGYRATRVH
jgi:hypothetical protein